MSRNGKGSTMILLAGIAWGLSGVSGQYLIAHGVGINALTSLRLIISGLVLSSMAYMRQRDAVIRLLKDKRLLRELLIYSLFGLTLNQYAYLLAIRYSNAGTATVLQYLSPILVLVYLSFKSRRCLAILGTVIMACHGDLSHLAINPIGLFWGLFAAVTYAYCVIKPAKLIADWGSLLIVGLAMLMGGVIFPILTRAWQYPLAMTYGNLRALFGIIGIGTIFAYTFFLKGASIIGPIKATLLASIEPVASVFFAIILMKETFHPIDLLGMALILIAVLVISLRDLLLAQRKKQLALKAK